MRIISLIIFVLLKIIFIETFCVTDCDSNEFKEVCAIRPYSDKEVVIQNKCVMKRQMCYDAEFNCDTYKFVHDGPCKGWDGWTYEKVGEKPCLWSCH